MSTTASRPPGGPAAAPAPADAAGSPFDPSRAADPYPVYAELRDRRPVCRIHVRDGLDPWVVSRHADVRAVLGDARLSTDPATASDGVRAAIARGRPEEKVSLLGRHLLATDPPDHTRARRLMSRALTPRRAAALHAPVTRWVSGLLDDLADRARPDLLADYTVPLAVHVACELLGVPEPDREPYLRCGRAFARAELDDDASFDAAADEMGGHLVPHVLASREREGEDLVALLAAGEGEDRLPDRQLVDIAYHLFFAGYESSAYFVCNAFLLLLTHPEQRRRAVADPAAMERAVEEALRFEGSVKVPTWRFATEDLELGGHRVRRGEPVLALLNSAGRDERQLPDADRFRVDRPSSPHLAFSQGIHHCLGAAVGRLESREALTGLFDRYPDVRLAVPHHELTWRDNLMMRGVLELPVALTGGADPEDGRS